jgi:hypothetical protein
MRVEWLYLFLGIVVFSGNTVVAAPVTFSGNTVDFSFKANAPGKLGQPAASEITDGSSLQFAPADFEVHAKRARRTLSKTIRIDIKADEGYLINGFDVDQGGEYLVSQGGRDNVSAKVRVVDHTNKRQNFTVKDSERFTSGEGDWSLNLEDGGKLDKPSSWITLFITEEVKAKGKRKLESWASLLSLNLSMHMVTAAGGPVTQVPVPAMVWLFAGSVAGLFGAAGRRRQPPLAAG